MLATFVKGSMLEKFFQKTAGQGNIFPVNIVLTTFTLSRRHAGQRWDTWDDGTTGYYPVIP